MADAPELRDEDDEPGGLLAWLRDVVVMWGPAFLAVIIIRTFIFEPFKIPSGSMVPTLLIGDHVLVTKFSYGIWLPWSDTELLDLGDPERGDVIVFRYPRDPSINYIKRVIGLPGDRVKVRDNQVILNDVEQPRELLGEYEDLNDHCVARTYRRWVEHLTLSDGSVLDHAILTARGLGGSLADAAEITVPPGHVFVMGDSRDNSEDSRRWGFVRYDQIKGKAHFVWLSWDGCSEYSGLFRFARMGHSLYAPPDPM